MTGAHHRGRVLPRIRRLRLAGRGTGLVLLLALLTSACMPAVPSFVVPPLTRGLVVLKKENTTNPTDEYTITVLFLDSGPSHNEVLPQLRANFDAAGWTTHGNEARNGKYVAFITPYPEYAKSNVYNRASSTPSNVTNNTVEVELYPFRR